MRPDSPRDRAAALAMGAGILVLLIVRGVSRLTGGGVSLDAGVLVAPAVGIAALVAGVVVLRWVLTRRALASRVVLELLPSEEFDPTPEDVEQLVAALGRVRPRGGWLTRAAGAVRMEAGTGGDGLLRMRVSCAGRSRGALEAALAAYPQVELREPSEDPVAMAGRPVRAVRVRLVLARPAREALAETGLQPDLLQGVAAAVAGLDPGRGEQARLVLDVRPLGPAEARRERRRLLGERRGQGLAAALNGEPESRRGRMSVGETIERRHDSQALDRKLAPQHPLLRFQLCLRVQAGDRQRALETTRSVLAVLDVLGAANHLRARGLRLGGLGFLGQDLPWRRRRFDRRLASGRFAGRRNDVVSPREVQGLLKPPTVHCHAENVARSHGSIPAPPRGLAEYTGRPDVIPLGWVQTRTGRRTVGVQVADTFFAYMSGRSRYGKTETAIGQFVALARAGHGGLSSTRTPTRSPRSRPTSPTPGSENGLWRSTSPIATPPTTNRAGTSSG